MKKVKGKLLIGYKDEDGQIHKDFEFGVLPKAKDFFFHEAILAFKDNDLSTINMQLVRSALSKLGSMETPISDSVLLKLEMMDFNKLIESFDDFNSQNGTPISVDTKTIKLAFPIEKDGEKFDVIEFGCGLTLQDELEADKGGFLNNGLFGQHRRAFIAGKQVAYLRKDNSDKFIETQITPDELDQMYLVDVIGLIEQANIFSIFRRFELEKGNK